MWRGSVFFWLQRIVWFEWLHLLQCIITLFNSVWKESLSFINSTIALLRVCCEWTVSNLVLIQYLQSVRKYKLNAYILTNARRGLMANGALRCSVLRKWGGEGLWPACLLQSLSLVIYPSMRPDLDVLPTTAIYNKIQHDTALLSPGRRTSPQWLWKNEGHEMILWSYSYCASTSTLLDPLNETLYTQTDTLLEVTNKRKKRSTSTGRCDGEMVVEAVMKEDVLGEIRVD